MRPADAKAVSTLLRRCFDEALAPQCPRESRHGFYADSEPWAIEARRRAGYLTWVCESHGRISGVLQLAPRAHVALLFVSDEHRRRGLARALVETAAQRLTARAAELTAHAFAHALDAYRQLGFIPAGPLELRHGIPGYPVCRPLSKA